jgi:hypothetical protein
VVFSKIKNRLLKLTGEGKNNKNMNHSKGKRRRGEKENQRSNGKN